MDRDDFVPIGTLARRTGLAVSAIRFYEERGLIRASRTAGNQRRFLRSDIRRLSIILIAQRLGLGLVEIEAVLATLPEGRSPSFSDWQQVSRNMRGQIDLRIQMLTRARSKLEDCIGCGCLSLQKCQLFNKDDRAGTGGPGPRYVLD
jgi:MerR family transcriptional regulator, redox-sensitive transcriptional activator SoxR